MWFPPYDLDFQENINVEWNSSKFLGRGESVWTYSNTERNGTLSFALLIDHPSIIDNIPKFIPKADNGNSASETGDLEWDVLRFFAGCDPLTFDINKVSSDEEPEQKMPSEEPAQTLPEKANKIKFYVFFPNNYSGHYNGGKGNINDAAPDADWYEYLIAGRDISVPEVSSKNEYIGYEIGDKGVTTDMSTGYSEETKIQSVSSSTIGFGYRVDGDLRQLLRNNFDGDVNRPRPTEQTNYNDRVSFKLNKTKYEKGGATDSFYDVYTALAEAFPSAYNGRNYGVLNDDSRKLASIFSSRKFTKIEIKGCATKQDDKNSVKLANRRAISIKTMLKKSGIDFGDIDLDDKSIFGIETEELKDMSDVNSLESKANRRASVTLYYDGPEIKTMGRIEPVSSTNLTHPRIVRETETVLQRDESGRTYFKEVQKKKDTNVAPERMVALKTISTTDKAAKVIFQVQELQDVIFVMQMYWLPQELLEKRVNEDKIPYDKWHERGLCRLCEGNKIRYEDVKSWFVEVQEDLDIFIPFIGYDAWSATYWTDSMADYFGKEAMIPVHQGVKTLSEPMKRCGNDLQSKRIIYNNNPIDKWCLANTAYDEDKNGNIQPHKTSRSTRRIDGTAALLDAYAVYDQRKAEYMSML